jgi:putative aldouronate transport system permease protein
MVLQVVLAFKDYRLKAGIWGSEWVGIANIRDMLSSVDFPIILSNTVCISLLRLGIEFLPPILLAIILYDIGNARFKKISQIILYIPHFFSWVIIYSIMYSLFSNQGLVNGFLNLINVESIDFLMSSKSFRPLIIGSDLWKEIGWGTILYIAALGNIDTELFEAAKLDGAGPIQRIRYVTLPGITSVIIFMLVLNLGTILKNAGTEQILLFYNPATYNVGDVIDTWVYRQGIGRMQYSMSACVSFFQSLFGLLLIWGANKISKKLSGVGVW